MLENAVAQQTIIFCNSLLLGAVFGVLYDGFRIFRLCLPSGRVFLTIQDILYFCICGVWSFLFLMQETLGEIRGFCLLGIILGAVLYHVTLGVLVMKCASPIIRFFKRILHWLGRIFLLPPLRLLLWISRKIRRFLLWIQGKIKKFFSFSQFHLKRNLLLLYNHSRHRQKGEENSPQPSSKGRLKLFSSRRRKPSGKTKQKRQGKKEEEFAH